MSDNHPLFMQFFIAISLGIAIYWYFYTGFIRRLKSNHALVYASLGTPTEMDSNLSIPNLRLWAFLIHFKFLQLGDRILVLFGFGVLGMFLFFPLAFIWAASANV